MQTIYYQTSSFIRHEGNVVDLGAYRRKLSAVSGGDWEDVPVQEPAPTQPEAAVPLLRLVPPESPKVRAARRRRQNVRRVGLALDLLASLAVVAVTVTAMVQFVRLANPYVVPPMRGAARCGAPRKFCLERGFFSLHRC